MTRDPDGITRRPWRKSRPRRGWWLSSWSLLLCALPLAAPSAQSVDELVEQVIATYGGAERLARVKALHHGGHVLSFQRGGIMGRLERTLERPDKLRVEITYPAKSPEVRILDGVWGWRQGETTPKPVHDAMLLQAARLSLPFILSAVRDELRDRGLAAGLHGVQVRLLELPLRHDLVLLMEIDPVSNLIVRTRGIMLGGPHPVMEFSSTYHEHRIFDGVLVPLREEQFTLGRHVASIVLDTVEFPDQASPGSFLP